MGGPGLKKVSSSHLYPHGYMRFYTVPHGSHAVSYGPMRSHNVPIHSLMVPIRYHAVPYGSHTVLCGPINDGHDKPFYTAAITIIDDFKNAPGDTNNR